MRRDLQPDSIRGNNLFMLQDILNEIRIEIDKSHKYYSLYNLWKKRRDEVKYAYLELSVITQFYPAP